MTELADNRASALSRLGIDFDALYRENFRMMVGLAIKRFHISETDAQALAHRVFLTFFLRAEEVRDPSAWLRGAICNASRQHHREQSRETPLPSDIAERADPQLARVADTLPDQLASQEALACCSSRCQLVLRLHYIEGYTIPEIAAQLHTTPGYAHKLVVCCLQQARERYGGRKKREQ